MEATGEMIRIGKRTALKVKQKTLSLVSREGEGFFIIACRGGNGGGGVVVVVGQVNVGDLDGLAARAPKADDADVARVKGLTFLGGVVGVLGGLKIYDNLAFLSEVGCGVALAPDATSSKDVEVGTAAGGTEFDDEVFVT